MVGDRDCESDELRWTESQKKKKKRVLAKMMDFEVNL
jgi:hypothetical protein